MLALVVSVCAGACKAESPEGDPETLAEKEIEEEEVYLPEHGPRELEDGGIREIPRDPELAALGGVIFEEKSCGECHSMDRDRRGPALGGVTEKRTPQWLAKMIMDPERMVRLDPVAKAQLSKFMCMMPDLGVTPEETRAVLAYLATYPESPESPEEASVPSED